MLGLSQVQNNGRGLIKHVMPTRARDGVVQQKIFDDYSVFAEAESGRSDIVTDLKQTTMLVMRHPNFFKVVLDIESTGSLKDASEQAQLSLINVDDGRFNGTRPQPGRATLLRNKNAIDTLCITGKSSLHVHKGVRMSWGPLQINTGDNLEDGQIFFERYRLILPWLRELGYIEFTRTPLLCNLRKYIEGVHTGATKNANFRQLQSYLYTTQRLLFFACCHQNFVKLTEQLEKTFKSLQQGHNTPRLHNLLPYLDGLLMWTWHNGVRNIVLQQPMYTSLAQRSNSLFQEDGGVGVGLLPTTGRNVVNYLARK